MPVIHVVHGPGGECNAIYKDGVLVVDGDHDYIDGEVIHTLATYGLLDGTFAWSQWLDGADDEVIEDGYPPMLVTILPYLRALPID